jgi:proline dehydrogenase
MIFDNTKQAYIHKTDKELYRALYLFRIISNKRIVFFGSKIAQFTLRYRLPIIGLFKHTIFKQFCGGLKKEDSIELVDRLDKMGVKSYMHYAAEHQNSESEMDINVEKTIETISFSKNTSALPFTVFKPTSFGSFSLFEKKSSGVALDFKESESWNRIIKRIQKCCSYADKLNVRILIDAEESWVQDGIDEISEDMMKKFNHKKTLIFTTVQLYRKDRLKYLDNLFKRSVKKKFKIGIKLVRGAYIEKENKRSSDLGVSSKIWSSKTATDKNFNAALDYILNRIKECELFLGSHNEKSVIKVIDWMKKNNFPNNYSKIWFSQLYGMADHISFNLASKGYQVVKYIPYGPIKEVIPYLIRRAQENSSVSSQTSRELYLIRKELKRRSIKEV